MKQRNWGIATLGLTLALALVRGYLEETPGHFRMFMGASRALWSGAPAYDTPFLGNLFFYSPASALFVYGPFIWFPERLGLLLYLALSGVIFIVGAERFVRARVPQRAGWALAGMAPAFFASVTDISSRFSRRASCSGRWRAPLARERGFGWGLSRSGSSRRYPRWAWSRSNTHSRGRVTLCARCWARREPWWLGSRSRSFF